MSFLGGVRWADLSSDTHSLSAAPPFCPGLDDDVVAPSPPGGGRSPHPAAFLGQPPNRRGNKNASDTEEALLLQCDAAAEQSYLNPSCASDLGCSNAGINLHFREAARLGCSSPVDEDMGEAGDPLRTGPARESAGNASPHDGVDGSTVVSGVERGRKQRVNSSAQQQRGGQPSSISSRRGRGSASGGGSVCAGFKGLLASTNSVGGGSDGAAVGVRKKWSRTPNSCPTTSGTNTHVSNQNFAASQGNRPLNQETHERTEPHRSAATSGSCGHKSGCNNIHAGDRRGRAHRSTDAGSTVHREHQGCGEEDNSPGGRKRYGEAKRTGRRRDIAKGGEHPWTSGAGTGRATEEQRDSGPDASDNWRSSPTREPGDLSATQVPEKAASRVCSHSAATTLCTRESQPEHRLAHAGTSGGENPLLKRNAEQPLVCFEASAQESHAQQQHPHASFEGPVLEKRAQQQQCHSLLSPVASVRENREQNGKRGSHLAARMMTPAKRHRPPVAEGPDGGSTVMQSGRECASGDAPAAEVDKNSAPAGTGVYIENAIGGEDISATARMENANAAPVADCSLLQGTAETSASTCQSHALQGPPPRKKKRAATETNKRGSVEMAAVAGVNTQCGYGVAAPSAAAPSSHPSSGHIFTHGEHQQRRGRRNSFLGAASATTVRGRRRSRAGCSGRTGEEHATQGKDSSRRFPGSFNQSSEYASGAAIAGSSLLQVAAQACPLLQLPGACFATPPYIMVPVAAATPLTTTRRSSSGSTVPASSLQSTAVGCGSAVAGKKARQHEQHKPAVATGASMQTNLVPASPHNDVEAEQEWARRASARMKDIAVGKATEGYKNFIRIVPKDKRRAGDPATPDPKQRCSKAKFQRELLDWRKQLHRYDGCCPPEDYGILPDNSCSSGGVAAEWSTEIVSRSDSPPVVDQYDVNLPCEGRNSTQHNSCNCSGSTLRSSVPTPLFSTPTGPGEQAAEGAVAWISHPDPIEQFNRECERTWL